MIISGLVSKQSVGTNKRTGSCFTDNNPNLTGREVCGKKVISFEKFKEIQNDYQIVITTKASYTREIREQLEKANIFNYLLFEAYAKEEEVLDWKNGYRVVSADEKR